jgi:hypothetical protein
MATLGRGDYDSEFRTHYQNAFGSTGSNYEYYAPVYQYGYRMVGEHRYRGRNFSQVESNLRREYETPDPGATWDKQKNAVRHGWDKVAGKEARRAGR